MQLYNRKINIGERDLFERGLKFEAADENEQAITCYIRAGESVPRSLFCEINNACISKSLLEKSETQHPICI